MTARKISWILVALVITCGVFFAVRPRSLPPRSTNPNWLKIVERVKNAKRVVTVASFENPLSVRQILGAAEKGGGEFVVHEVTDREKLSQILELSEDSESEERAACFCPHHFVIAYQDGDPLLVALCFSCGHIRVYEGEKEIETFSPADLPDNYLTESFGLARSPDHDARPPCGVFNEVGDR